MSTREDYIKYRRSLDVLRNELKLCMYYKIRTLAFDAAGRVLLDRIDKEHEYCNKSIGELTV